MPDEVDSRYSWVVVGICFVIYFLNYGMVQISGLFFSHMIFQYSAERESASRPFLFGSVARAIAGPVCGYLSYTFGFRLTIALGCLIASLGIFACSFAQDVNMFAVFWTVFGFGYGLSFAIMPRVINLYHKKHASKASGIALCGPSGSGVILPFLALPLLDSYGLPGTLMVLSAVMLNTFPAIILLRDPTYLYGRRPRDGFSNKCDEATAVPEVNEVSSERKISLVKDCEEKATLGELLPLVYPEVNKLSSKRNISLVKDCKDKTTLGELSSSKPGPRRKDSFTDNCEDEATSVAEVVELSSENKTWSLDDCQEQKTLEELPTSTFYDNSATTQIDDKMYENLSNCECESVKTSEKTCLAKDCKEHGTIEELSPLVLFEIGTTIKINDKLLENLSHKKCELVEKQLPENKAMPPVKTSTNSVLLHNRPLSLLSMLNIFWDPLFISFSIVRCFITLVFATMPTIIVDFLMDKGVPENLAAYVLPLYAAANLLAKILFGWITDSNYISRINYVGLWFLIQSFSFFVMVWSDEFVLTAVALAVVSMSCSTNYSTLFVAIDEYFEKDMQSFILPSLDISLLPMCFGTARLIGHFRDDLGSYDGLVYILSAAAFVCSVVVLFIPRISSWRTKRRKKILCN